MIRVKTIIEIDASAAQTKEILAAVAKAQQKIGLPSLFVTAADAPDPGSGPGEEPPPGGGQ